MISREKITTNASNQLLEKRQARRCNWVVIQANRSAGRCECQSKQLHAPSPQRHPPMQFCLVIAIIFAHNHKTRSFLDWRAICFAFSPLRLFSISLSLSCGQIWSPRCDENHPKKHKKYLSENRASYQVSASNTRANSCCIRCIVSKQPLRVSPIVWRARFLLANCFRPTQSSDAIFDRQLAFEQVMDAWDRTCRGDWAGGNARQLLCTGSAGIGKTAFMHSLDCAAPARRGRQVSARLAPSTEPLHRAARFVGQSQFQPIVSSRRRRLANAACIVRTDDPMLLQATIGQRGR